MAEMWGRRTLKKKDSKGVEEEVGKMWERGMLLLRNRKNQLKGGPR